MALAKCSSPENVEVYNLICDSLSITPMPNNGTLRLPLKPIGLHSNDHDNKTEAVELPSDPTHAVAESSNSTSKGSIGIDPPDPVPTRPVIVDEGGKGQSKLKQLWSSVSSKFAGLKSWVHDLISGSHQEERKSVG